jgi:hypothetical protein
MSTRALQLGALAMIIGGFVVLTLEGKDVSAFIGLVTPVLTTVFVVNHLHSQDRVLTRISENTNGVLTQKIEDAVSRALAARSSDRGARL